MSDVMTPIPFKALLNWVLAEKENRGQVFGIHTPFKKEDDKVLEIFGEKIETPFGPAAGPHTQLAQNIIAAYYAGCRFFELKTIQIMDGEELAACVHKPCILADDEGYNCEWSTELYVPQAFDEYVKAWFVLKLISKEYGLGDPDGFVFNMSVGYDLKGIQSPKIDKFIDEIQDVTETDVWKNCVEEALLRADDFKYIDEDYIKAISPKVCHSVTVSTLHGCPPQEIESIASYLIKEKHLHTFIKCNPTLLGYETARQIMDSMGYDYVVFGDFHFKDDLQFEDAVPMLERLMDLAKEQSVAFGVKITNTFPVDVTRGELPSEEMYMSGRSLTALSLSVAYKLSKAFDGKLRISYSGGADYFNIDKIYETGIWPITIATSFLKPGGYQRGVQIAEKLDTCMDMEMQQVDLQKLSQLIEQTKNDPHHVKPMKALPLRKIDQKVPLVDCFFAPCEEGCPIHQDIPTYIQMVGEGRYEEALRVILDKNPLPWITGTICNHRCMSKCTRNFYEEPVQIRSVKLEAAKAAYEQVLPSLIPTKKEEPVKVAVIGAGPAGIAAAYFLAREGMAVEVFEKRSEAGGTVKYVIPEFRIPSADIDKDVALAKQMGAKFTFDHEVENLEELRSQGFEKIIVAVGASKGRPLGIESEHEENAIAFMEACKYHPETLNAGKNVVVIGAGNSAMDAARAAKRLPDVDKVSIVYRRDVRNMPADEEELELAKADGVELLELLAPVSHKDGKLLCHKVILGELDATGRQTPMVTEEEVVVAADTVIASLGEQVDGSYYEKLGLKITERGYAAVHSETLEASKEGVYVIGDGLYGPATVVKAIANAAKATNAIAGTAARKAIDTADDLRQVMMRKGILAHCQSAETEKERCLECHHICENCVDVCPNRANIAIEVPGKKMPVIIHMDQMCNECGNCKSFCPYDSAPYKEKLTVFSSVDAFEESDNEGFVWTNTECTTVRVRLGAACKAYDLSNSSCSLDEDIKAIIETIKNEYRHLMIPGSKGVRTRRVYS